jgi:glutathionylspermidine synthase
MYAFNNCSFDKPDELENAPNHHYVIKGAFTVYNGKDVEIIEDHSVKVKARDVFKYHQGELIQNCFPYLSIKDREFLISGTWIEPLEEEEE